MKSEEQKQDERVDERSNKSRQRDKLMTKYYYQNRTTDKLHDRHK